jgi:hypothetical protein
MRVTAKQAQEHYRIMQQHVELDRSRHQQIQSDAHARQHVQELQQDRILRARRLQSGRGENVDTYA